MIALRLATTDDAAGIARTHVDAWHKAYDGTLPDAMNAAVCYDTRLDMWQALLANYATTHPTWVAVDGKKDCIAGFAMASRIADADLSDAQAVHAEIHMVFVAPGYQRRDLGRRLFEAFGSWLVAQGCITAMASVLETSQAVGFFRAMGGVELTSTQLDMPGPAVIQHLFIWRDLAANLSLPS